MEKSIQELLEGSGGNYILPFLWMRGEEEAMIREEIDKIDACGIKAVCLEARPHPDYAGEGWWKDVDIVLDEAKKRGMKIWILDDAHFPTGMANGLLETKYPERAKQYVNTKCFDVAGPLPCAELDVQEIMKKQFTWMDIGKPISAPLKDEKELVSVTAMRLIEGDIISDEWVNLTEYVKDGILTYSFPKGLWRVLVTFTTYDGEGKTNYINIIDRESVQVLIEAVYEKHYERYQEDFGQTFAGFFSDEPGFDNTSGFSMDESIGRKLMPLPWNQEVPKLLEERLGESWKMYLPYLWYASETEVLSAKIRFVYMDILTKLYEKNFSCQLGEWCAAHGVEYIGHVIEDNNQHSRLGCGAGHYFRAMKGQHMAGIDNIGGQVMFGNPDGTRHGWSVSDGKFFQYVISKMGASAALLDPKKKGRLMCETYGAYGWGTGVKHMKWITDHLISRGVNHLVPHAFSMAEYPDQDCPPHFYARGNNPQFPYFAELMKYANRLCHVFNGGTAVPQAGILYHGELEWMNACMFMQEPAKVLFQNQIDFCIVPIDALDEKEQYRTMVKNGKLYINDVQIPVLIVPETRYIDSRFAEFLNSNPEVNCVFLNQIPEAVVERDTASCEELWKNCPVTRLEELASWLKKEGIQGLGLEGEYPYLTCYHYRKEQDIYMLFNESSHDVFSDTLRFQGEEAVYQYDALKNCIHSVVQSQELGITRCSITLKPYESIILIRGGAAECDCQSLESTKQKQKCVEKFDISCDWMVSMVKAKEYPNFQTEFRMEMLEPISKIHPKFSGIIKYRKQLRIENTEGRFVLKAEHIFETGRIRVNGEDAGMRLCPPYEFDFTEFLHKGDNLLEIEVANTLARDVQNYESQFGPERVILEPSGMFGTIELVQYI